jgi:ATP-dependent RNA helicase DDX56/DBP9
MTSTNNSLYDQEITWTQNTFKLDRRLIKALVRMGFIHPTLVQSKAIPIALEGKDMLIRARTGSGKTVAFALPLLQKILQMKETTNKRGGNSITEEEKSVKAIILVPTKDLIKQIEKSFNDLTYYCKDFLSYYAIHNDDSQSIVDFHLQTSPDILISTPAKLVTQLERKSKNGKSLLSLQNTSLLVIDEADLVLSYGYKDDIHKILSEMPKIFQGIFLSATLSSELNKFKKLILHNPAILKLEENKEKGNLLQFYLESNENDKYLILYVFIKLGLLQGKGLIFVNDVNKCYRLKLFLQQFYISAAVLNAEVPANSRNHILEEYNRGLFNYLIASDAVVDKGDEDDNDDDSDDESSEEEGAEEEAENDSDDANDDEGEDSNEDNEVENADSSSKKKKQQPLKKQSKKEKKNQKKSEKLIEKDEFGVSRGIDFQGVNFVINFDFPKTSSSYIHRIGRTARGINNGTALSFITKSTDTKDEDYLENKIAIRDHTVLTEVRQKQPRLEFIEGDHIFAAMGAIANSSGNTGSNSHQNEEIRMQPSPLLFNTAELEPFRYRVEDTLRSVTGVAVRELRTAEIKKEILNSEKLKSYFVENPNDLKVVICSFISFPVLIFSFLSISLSLFSLAISFYYVFLLLGSSS